MRITAASLAVALALAAATTAQSPLTTTYVGGNGLGGSTMMWFDITVNTAITITQIDVNALAASTAGSIDIYTRPGTRVGFETSVAGWTLQGNVAVATPSPVNTPTVCALTSPFLLTPGNYGFAIGYNGGLGQAYTNGPLGPYSTAELTLIQGGSGGIWAGIVNTPRVFNGSIHYLPAGGGFATKSLYGTGCYNRFRSFYENFGAATAFDLSNTSLSMIYNGSGYTVVPGITTFVTPSGTALTIAAGDDVEQTVTLGSALNHPGGSTTALTVCSNGFISTAVGNGVNWVPGGPAFLAFSQTCWSMWHDFTNTNAGSGPVKFEEVGSVSIVTWQNVADYLGGGFSTFQFQFDRSNGNVHLVCQGVSTLGNSGFLTGYKPGGTVLDPGSRDISATLASTFVIGSPETLALALDASARPVLGTTINLVTTNFPGNSGLGANILSFTQHNPGLDLAGLGMPGCRQFTGLDSSVFVIPVAGTASRSFTLPNNPVYAGIHVFSMSAAFSAGANPLGVVSSNGLDLGVNVN